MSRARTPDASFPLVVALFGLTFVTGLIDGVSFLGLGHVFTANMTGNVVFRVCARRRRRSFNPSFARSARRLRERQRRGRDCDQQATANSRPAPADRNVCRGSLIE